MNGLEEIRVRGGTPLCGSITIQGSKNAALPVMAASLLHRGVSVLRKCPRITDVFCMEEILKSLGSRTDIRFTVETLIIIKIARCKMKLK